MAHAVLEKDSTISFPHFTLLKASAGSGKTYSWPHEEVRPVPPVRPDSSNHLRNILAITFSNNAAKS